MVKHEAVADPLRAKRPLPESEGTKEDSAVTVFSSDQTTKRIKTDDGEMHSPPLQKAPEPQAHAGHRNTKQQTAVKQETATTNIAKAPLSVVPTITGPSVPTKTEALSASHVKSTSGSKPQALSQPPLQQSAPQSKPQYQTATSSVRASVVPPAPATASLNTTQVHEKESSLPLKCLTFRHLHKKYGPELDYMLVEFKKLERQLLGAPTHQQNPAKIETKGSRERREKLHGFILHLEDTLRQVDEGLALEEDEKESSVQAVLDAVNIPKIENVADQKQKQQPPPEEEEKKSSDVSLQQPEPNPQPNAQINFKDSEKTSNNTNSSGPKFTAAEASLSSLPPEKEREESVQRLEEHILANLLPVKVRLTKQLAAQKGATRNPLTAPVRAGAPATSVGGTIAEAVEAKRKAQEEELLKKQLQQRQTSSQFGKPIGGTGSSLTNRLHGEVLGSGTSPSSGDATGRRPILYAGVAPGSTQISSSVSAVSGAHPGLVGKDATRALTLAEEERRRLKALEENATRVALGVVKPGSSLDHKKLAALTKQPEGPATLAARARAVALAAANSGGGMSKISRPNQQFPARPLQQNRPPLAAAAAAAIAASKTAEMNHYAKSSYVPVPISSIPTKPKKPHVAPNFNEPGLTPEQRFELRMKEARWRQHKRRRERRRKRLESYFNTPGTYHTVPVQQQQLQPPPQKPSKETHSEPRLSAPTTLAPPPQPPTKNSPPQQVASASRPKKEEVFGPRTVEYVCAICNDTYVSTCEFNPWWALSSQECPKCGKVQIPKLDISVSANDIEYHPALLNQEDNIKTVGSSATKPNNVASCSQLPTTVKYVRSPTQMKKNFSLSDSEVSFTDESDGEGCGGKYTESSEEEDTTYDNDMDSVTREERAEKEEFGYDFKGETLSEEQSRKLLVLIEHASICPGR